MHQNRGFFFFKPVNRGTESGEQGREIEREKLKREKERMKPYTGLMLLICGVQKSLFLKMSGWPSGLRRCVQVAVYSCRRGFESHS